MKKKLTLKLTLKKEALKNLTPAELGHVAGGTGNAVPDTILSAQCNSR